MGCQYAAIRGGSFDGSPLPTHHFYPVRHVYVRYALRKLSPIASWRAAGVRIKPSPLNNSAERLHFLFWLESELSVSRYTCSNHKPYQLTEGLRQMSWSGQGLVPHGEVALRCQLGDQLWMQYL
jgi:hypothetical protein